MTENPSTSPRTTAMWIGVSQMTIQRMLSDLDLQQNSIHTAVKCRWPAEKIGFRKGYEATDKRRWH